MPDTVAYKQINLKLPEDVYERFQEYCARHDRSVQWLLLSGGKEFLKRQERAEEIEQQSMASWLEYMDNEDFDDISDIRQIMAETKTLALDALKRKAD